MPRVMPIETRTWKNRFRKLLPQMGRFSPLLAAGLICSAPLAVGAIDAYVLIAFGALAWLGLVLHSSERAFYRRPTHTSWLGLPLVLGALWTLFSILPLPRALRMSMAPAQTERVEWVTALLREENQALLQPVWSLDPPESAMALMRLLAGLCLFIVLSARCKHRDVRHQVYRVFLVGAFALFVVALLHRLANLPLIWGVFKASSTPFYAPLVNTNHLARAFGAFSLLCIGRAFVVRSRVEAFWFAFAGVLCGAGVMLTLSRGGILVYFAVLIGLGAFLFWANRQEGDLTDGASSSSKWLQLVMAQMSLILVIGVGLYAAHEAILLELGTLGDERLESSKAFLYPLSLRLLSEYGALGVGNGAFGAVFPSLIEVGELTHFGTFSHAENIVVQTLTDHGYVVGGALLVFSFVVLGGLCLYAREKALLGPLAAVLFLVGGDLFDFALETPFGTWMVAGCLALAVAELPNHSRLDLRLRIRYLVLSTLVFGVVGIYASTLVLDNRLHLDAALAHLRGPERVQALEEALAKHPTDAHYAYRLAGEARLRKNAKATLEWANRALMLWPGHADAHIEAARALAALGHGEQSLLEYRLAWMAYPGRAGEILREVAARTDDVTLREKSLPPNDAGARARLCALLVSEQRLDEGQACYDEALQMERADLARYRRQALQLALRRKDLSTAKTQLHGLLGDAAPDGDLAPLAANVLALEGGLEAAFVQSGEWLKNAMQPRALWHWRLSTAMRLNRPVEAFEALARLRPLSKGTRDVDRLDRAEASLRARQGELGDALGLWRRISRRAPKDVGALLQQGRLELRLGFLEQATDTLARLNRMAPERADVVGFGEAISVARAKADGERLRGMQ